MANDKVVISGISGRFPNANSIAELKYNLFNKVDCTTTEHNRWDSEIDVVPHRMGICNNVTKFDRVFFGVHSKLTIMLDPALRLLFEATYEAIMDAGVNPKSLRGKNVSVYTATSISESEKCIFSKKFYKQGFGIIGGSKAMSANRVSFFLGLNGSSINIDAAESGSAIAIERAYHDIKNGLTDAAIVSGYMSNLHPQVSYQLHALGILSMDGRTRSFDDNGSGSTRSDSVSVIFLQRARDARRIYHEIVNVQTQHLPCTNRNSCFYATTESQIRVLKQSLDKSNLSPDDIGFVEANGVGIRDIDALELETLDEIYGKRKEPLYIGSIKSVIGNTIPANTVNGILKMIIASETGQIPPNQFYETPNSKVSCLKKGRIQVLTEVMPLKKPYISINTISHCGAVSNVILKVPDTKKRNRGVPNDDLPRLVVCSGRTTEAVAEILNFVESQPIDVEFLQLLYGIFESDIHGHLCRGYTLISPKNTPIIESKKQEIRSNSGESRQVWWIFSGMGSQWVGMGEALLKLPVFAAAIRKCDAVLKPLGYDIYKILCDKDPKMFDNIINSFIGIAAVQIGLVDVLKFVGVEPDYVIGHSVGELGCAYADGCFTAEQMIMAALSRGLASIESELLTGSMAAVGLGYEAIKKLCPPNIDVACHNGPDSSTISGPADSLKKFVESLTAKGIFAKEVACSNIAYHSRYIAPAGTNLLNRLEKVIPDPKPRTLKWISTSVPRGEWNTVKARLCSADYHTNNLLSPVLFDESSRLIPPNAICIEIAPHGLLQAIVKKSLPESCINIPLTRRGHKDNLEVLFTGLGKIYNAGLNMQISKLYPKVEYPVSRGTPSISSLIKWDHSSDWPVYLQFTKRENKEGVEEFSANLNDEKCKDLRGNFINGTATIPLSWHLNNVWEVYKTLDNNSAEGKVLFEDIKVHKLVQTISFNSVKTFMVAISKGSNSFEITDSNTLLMTGIIRKTSTPNQDRLDVKPRNLANEKFECNKDDFYTELEMRGYQYSEAYKNVVKSKINGTSGVIAWKDCWMSYIDSALQLYIFGNDLRQIEVPLLIHKIVIDEKQLQNGINNSKEVIALVDKELNYVSLPGLEIQGLKFSAVANNLEQNRLSSDVLSIVPNLDKSNLLLPISLRLILQVILENIFSENIQRIQLIKGVDSKKVEILKTTLYEVPEASFFQVDAIPYEKATFNKALTVIVDDLKNYDLSEISQKLGKDKFILIFVNTDQRESYIKSLESLNLRIILIKNFANESLILLRKKYEFKNLQVINASKNTKETIDKIKSTRASSESERIIVTIKSKDKINFDELFVHIQGLDNLEKIRLYIIHDSKLSDNPFNEQFYKNQVELDLFINILTSERVWATFRRTTAIVSPQLSKTWIANHRCLNDPNSITWTEGPLVENNDNIIKVEYSTLNSQDTLIAHGNFYSEQSEITGINRLNQISLGLEFSGVDSKGNRVMGITCGNAMSNFVKADNTWTWSVPKTWSLEDAATVPFSYAIAYSSLVVNAEAQPGETVMIINACTGAGPAILNLAIKKKCDVFVAYETEAERKIILSAAPNIPNNRLFKLNHENLRDEILLETQGQGVNVLIYNQCEPKNTELFINKCIKPPRVILISDLNDNKIHYYIGMGIFLKQARFFSVVPKKLLLSNCETRKTLVNLIKDGIASGSVKPLAKTVYPRDSLNRAFNDFCNNASLEKIVIKVQPEGSNKNEALAIPRLYCSKSKSYLIVEGLTMFGLELIDWLITKGARHFVVASSFENNSEYKNLRFRLWESYGVKIVLHQKIDLSQQQNVQTLLKKASSLGPVDAIFDLRRTNTVSTTPQSANLTSKILDEESRLSCPKLRLFVVLSTVENIGFSPKKFEKINQYKYSQDQTVEEILMRRKNDGLYSLMVRMGTIDSSEVVLPLPKYVQKLDEILGTNETVVEVFYAAPNFEKNEIDVVELNLNKLDPHYKEHEEFKNLIFGENVLVHKLLKVEVNFV